MDVHPDSVARLERALTAAGFAGLKLRRLGDVATLSGGLPVTREALEALFEAFEAFGEASPRRDAPEVTSSSR